MTSHYQDCETCAHDQLAPHIEPCNSCTRWDGKTRTHLPRPTGYQPRSIDDATPAQWSEAGRKLREALGAPGPAPSAVDHPPHYTAGNIECIDYMRDVLTPEEFRGYLRGQVIKYQHRLMHKGRPGEDAGKLAWYAQRLAEALAK